MPAQPEAIKAVFLAAVEKATAADRASFLDEACAGDAALRQRVEGLLRVHDLPDQLLDHPAVRHLEPHEETAETLDFLTPSQRPGARGRLGHYEVLDVVGKGGMGLVMRAFDDKLQRVVAIKVLAPHLAASGTARQRFVREARAAAAVTHDNVIAIHAVADDAPIPYLVMQFIDGRTLQEKLDRSGPLPLKELLRIGAQVASGLAAAHRLGLTHRDVKPANILLENGVERVKLTDFGLARAADLASLTQSGVIAGTPMYMAPEQADGESVDYRADLFSLGSVLYAMATGLPPFRAATTMGILKRVCEETPRPIREVNPQTPVWLCDLIANLHAKDPAKRFAQAQEVADLLARRLAELQQPGKAADSARARPRRRWFAVAAALVVLALGVCEATGISRLLDPVMALFSGDGVETGSFNPVPTATAPQDTKPADPTLWARTVAALPAEDQVKAVAAKLKELNPGFDGQVTPVFLDGAVWELTFDGSAITDISPVNVLEGLHVLHCRAENEPGKLKDLSPLAGSTLTFLDCHNAQVEDLSPLRNLRLATLNLYGSRIRDLSPLRTMPLRALVLGKTGVTDLAPLKGMNLKQLNLFDTRVKDLSPLAGMPLEALRIGLTEVADLAPLKGMPLKILNCRQTTVRDLSPLRGMPLESVFFTRTKVLDRDMANKNLEVLRSLKNLATIDNEPAAEWMKRSEQDN